MEILPPGSEAVTATVSLESRIELQALAEQQAGMSELAQRTLQYIAASTRLSPESKRSLIRLTAIIDQYAQGSPKLFRQLAGTIQLMESQVPAGRYSSHSPQEAVKAYAEERDTLDKRTREQGFRLSVEIEISETYKQWLSGRRESSPKSADARPTSQPADNGEYTG